MFVSRASSRRVAGASGVAVLALTAAAVGIQAPAAQAVISHDGLIVEYVFDSASGAEVENTAPEGTVGAAVVQNAADEYWGGSFLRLPGGAKDSANPWVRLPDDILSGVVSATVSTEIKVDSSMLSSFHFLWNIGNDTPDTEYIFASVNCGNNRSPLAGIKSAGTEHLVASQGCGIVADQWVNVTSVFDDGDVRFYIDGEQVAQREVGVSPADVIDQSFNTIGRAPWPDPLFHGEIATFRIYDRALDAEQVHGLSAADASLHAEELQARAWARLDALDLADISTDTHVDLPSESGLVTWTSSNPEIVAPDGTVNPPPQGESAASVELTATTSIRGQEASQTITVTVLPSAQTAQERFEQNVARYVIPPSVATGVALPTPPAGLEVESTNSESDAVQISGGLISAAGDEVVQTRLSVVLTDGEDLRTTRTFDVRVHPSGTATAMNAYYRHATTDQEANNTDIALSMHLAIGTESEGARVWSPLNENYGIYFALTSEKATLLGPSAALMRSLKEPFVFELADGGYGVVAVRTLRGGGADPESRSSVLMAVSEDLRSFDEIGMLDLGVSSGINSPRAVYDSAADHYLISWTSDAGVEHYTSIAELEPSQPATTPQRGTVSGPAVISTGEDIPNYAAGHEFIVPVDVAAQLQVRFGRISNTSVDQFTAVEVQSGASVKAGDLPERAGLNYDDGSTGSLPVIWDQGDLEAVDTSTPGEYQISGQILQQVYEAPFADERADPSIYKFDFNGETKFLMIATEDINNDVIEQQGRAHMPIRMGDSIEELSDEAIRQGRNQEIDLLVRGDLDAYGAVMTGCFWAPEFHMIQGTLSILFMPCYDGANGRPTMWTGRASIIQLEQDENGRHLDPTVASNWSAPAHVVRADGSELNQTDPNGAISLDMTYFEDSGRHYYSWQMLGSIFIAQMDPSDPLRLTTEPTRIVLPEYAWDNAIAEGPNVYVRDGKLHMIYSGSTVGDTYTTGLAVAPAGVGANLEDESTWEKLNYPIQKSGIYNGEWQLGTGHGMWSEDEHGNQLYVFHARTTNLGLAGRDTFVRRVHWASDGLPVFDMELDEEVLPELRTVSLTVVVTESATIPTDPDDGGAPTDPDTSDEGEDIDGREQDQPGTERTDQGTPGNIGATGMSLAGVVAAAVLLGLGLVVRSVARPCDAKGS